MAKKETVKNVDSSIDIPSVLSFERKIACSDGLFYGGNWDKIDSFENWEPLKIQEKSIKGVTSNRQKTQNEVDPLKLNLQLQNANLQTIDFLCLPFNFDTLKVKFSVKILSQVYNPSTCNNEVFRKAFFTKISDYITEYNFKELSFRYAENLANARFLWRNRLLSEKIHIKIEEAFSKKSWLFDGLKYDLHSFSKEPDDNLVSLASTIAAGLKGESFVCLEVEAFCKIGAGQEIFPSQEFIQKDDNADKTKKSKFLYSTCEIAAFHSQKLGNAIRTIDTWYEGATEPIPIETYGTVSNKGIAYRPIKKGDFYTLFDTWISTNAQLTENEKHYVVAVLLRGGVFGKGKDRE